jgi:hypothetical protein
MKTFLKILSLGALAVGCFSILGCGSSFMGVALQSMTVSKVDDYFDLESTQKDQLNKDVEKDLKEMRQDVFPQVAKSLRELDVQFSKDSVSAPGSLMAKIFEDSESYLKKVTVKFENTAVKTAATLNESQFQYFAKKIRENIEESQEDTNSPEGALKQSMKRYTKSVEFWVGNISRDQKTKLRDFLKNHPYPWSLQNKSKQAVLDQFLNSRKNPEELKKFVKGFATDYDTYRLPEFKAALKVHQTAFQEFFATSLWPSIEKKQKQELKENLLNRAESLEKLARN